MLRIPIGWTDMNQPILITEMEKIIALGKTYSFKFMFVLMDRVSGWWDTGANPRNLLPDKWADQEIRIQSVVEHFRHEDQIYAWALSNELNVFQEVVHEWYVYFVPFVKIIDTDTPICTSFYSLGLNSSTISAAESLSEIGLDFVEFHYYPTEASDIVSDVDQLTAFVQKPIFLSEFGVNGGLNGYNTDVNKRILNETIQEFQKRPNVLGLAYYRWSDDNDDYSIWNSTSQTPRPESEVLSVSTSFLQRFPYPCLRNLQSSQTTEHSIDDPSFQTVTEWPDETGWVKWNNHTSYELVNVTTPTVNVSGQTQVDFSNYDFEDGSLGWNLNGSGNYVVESTIAQHGNKSLKMWATDSNDFQMQYNVSGLQADHAYLLEGWVKVTEANNAGVAFIQLAFRNNSTTWTHWSEAESVDRVTDWVAIHASAIAPDNVTDLLINCRVKGNGGNVTAYFDYLTLWEVPSAAYDGNSYMVAFGEEMAPEWNALQLSQGFKFTNPPDDIKKTWTFSA